MIIVYISLALGPVALWRFRSSIAMWTTLLMCGANIVVLGLVVANVGALHRMRFVYLATFCALSLAAGMVAVADRRTGHREVARLPLIPEATV